MVGNDPANGASKQLIMTAANDATLPWPWTTHYQPTAAAGAHGSVIPTNSWRSFGSNMSIAATADTYYHFTHWTGDVSSGDVYANPLNLSMDGPKGVAAVFDENLAAAESGWQDLSQRATVPSRI